MLKAEVIDREVIEKHLVNHVIFDRFRVGDRGRNLQIGREAHGGGRAIEGNGAVEGSGQCGDPARLSKSTALIDVEMDDIDSTHHDEIAIGIEPESDLVAGNGDRAACGKPTHAG